MNKPLIAACLSFLSVAAVGCVEQDTSPEDTSVDPALIEALERRHGFEVILVDGVGSPSAHAGDDEKVQLDDSGLSYAPRPDLFHGGADLVRDNTVLRDPNARVEGDTSGDIDTTAYPADGEIAITEDAESVSTSREQNARGMYQTGPVGEARGMYVPAERTGEARGMYVPAERTGDARGMYAEVDDHGFIRGKYSKHQGSNAQNDELSDPCSCAGDNCRKDWVEENLGCNVCAVFVCGEDNTPHSCNACPQ